MPCIKISGAPHANSLSLKTVHLATTFKGAYHEHGRKIAHQHALLTRVSRLHQLACLRHPGLIAVRISGTPGEDNRIVTCKVA